MPATEPPKEPLHLTLKPFDQSFRRYLRALAVFTLGNSSDAFLLVRAGELGVQVTMLPLLWCVFHIVKSSSNLLLGRAVDKSSVPGLSSSLAGSSMAWSTLPSAW